MTFRGRLGYTIMPQLLAYGTAGVAVGSFSLTNAYSDNHTHAGPLGGNGQSTLNGVKVGWAAGAGVEYAIMPNWTLRGEYLYVDLGSVSTTATITDPPHPGETTPLTTTTDLTAHLVRVGLNYRLP